MRSRIPPDFTHLRVFSQYSLMQATASVGALVERAAGSNFGALALTDMNALYGVVAFSAACRQAGIKPILGATFDVNPLDIPVPIVGEGTRKLTLLASGPSGYRSLCGLSSALLGDRARSAQGGEALTRDELQSHKQGLICLDGGRRGWLQAYLRAGEQQAAARYIHALTDVFGRDCVLSLEVHSPGDVSIADAVCDFGARCGVPVAVVHPVYCLHPDERASLKLLAAIQHNCELAEVPAAAWAEEGDPNVDLHWLDAEQLAARYAAYPEALSYVGELVHRCEPALPGGNPIWPVLKLPRNTTPDQELRSQAQKGLRSKYGSRVPEFIHNRMSGELESIIGRGFATLFIIVADVVRFARQAEIPVSTRGSVANSLVAYCLGITSVDPIANDLLFERFLSPARKDLPDIDLDFCSRRRDEILSYVRTTYGEDRVALVGTINTMQPKSAVGETAKAYGLTEPRIRRLVARLPRRWHPDPRRRDRRRIEDLLRELENPLERQIVREGYKLVGQPRHLSVHPGGVVITPGSLTDHLPVQWAPKGFLITQFDHVHLEAVGIPKLDLLGIRALTVLMDASDLVREHHEKDFSLERIPLDDTRTGDLLCAGDTIGVFQCESAGAQRTLRQLNARSVQDLAVANAFFKPGPATGGMAQAFVRRYRGEEAVAFLHPALEPILGRTKGVLIFQEQILRLAREIAGLSWEEADYLRRGMSKFRPKEMEAMQARFIKGCMRPPGEGPGFTRLQAGQLWEQVAAFAGYGFNQGHATAYAMVSYRSAYLKAHWPEIFLCARLADRGGYHHPAVYMAEARRLGIDVRPPHVNHSGRHLSLTYSEGAAAKRDPILWLGLDEVRDLQRRTIKAIVHQRTDAPFEGVADLLRRVPLQEREIMHLIQCGALDGLVENRSQALERAAFVRRAGTPQQISFDFVRPSEVSVETPAQRMAWEKAILGLPVSVTPLELIERGLENIVPLMSLGASPQRDIELAGYKLPGWTGGPGFFFGDGDTFIRARFDEAGRKQQAEMKTWSPIRLRGNWCVEPWKGSWFQIDAVQALQADDAGLG